MSGRVLSITNTYVVDGMNSVKREEERNGEADPDAKSNKQGRREGKGEKARGRQKWHAQRIIMKVILLDDVWDEMS